MEICKISFILNDTGTHCVITKYKAIETFGNQYELYPGCKFIDRDEFENIDCQVGFSAGNLFIITTTYCYRDKVEDYKVKMTEEVRAILLKIKTDQEILISKL